MSQQGTQEFEKATVVARFPVAAGPLREIDGLSRGYLIHHGVCPLIRNADGALLVATAAGASPDALDDISLRYGTNVVAEAVTPEALQRSIERVMTAISGESDFAAGDLVSGGSATDISDLITQPPVVRYVNLLIAEAHIGGASDVHLQGTDTQLHTRFRLDGVLVNAPEPPPGLQHAIISRIKLLADLDIAERRRPQDGRIRVRMEDRELDLRVSTVPTMHGESVVLRLLDRGGRPVTLSELGMPPDILSAVETLAARPHGMVLVTGPTGSGKTTTLYAALQQRDRVSEKIITVEDPVEYEFTGVVQVPVHRQAGVTFASALRSILRQDPDVIMIGEMRDPETAEIAVQAAMTGHIVFSTLHTNDAVGAIPRLLDLGVPEYLMSATLNGILAQRLVRLICDMCREQYEPSSTQLQLLEECGATADTLQHGRGCENCRGTGYRGRVGVFEVVMINDELRDAISKGRSRKDLKESAVRGGMRPLATDAWRKVASGQTTVEEVLRVVQR